MTRRYNQFLAITKSDDAANNFAKPTDAIYVGTAGATGTLVGVKVNGDTVTLVGLTAGTMLLVQLARVNDTTTDVSDLVALYEV